MRYETGATTHAVNDLILFTDNTRELAELRDFIYRSYHSGKYTDLQYPLINNLMATAMNMYLRTFPAVEDHKHIATMSIDEQNEYISIYTQEYETWITENM